MLGIEWCSGTTKHRWNKGGETTEKGSAVALVSPPLSLLCWSKVSPLSSIYCVIEFVLWGKRGTLASHMFTVCLDIAYMLKTKNLLLKILY